ncbi:unnamed protein product [Eruca vesicaria subsp. sativa]|uniref:Pachytene checkpoint protein 2 homolog n=1 Tax=Eruca vesicaria subsp. sativa TaxID=29727 RepID=A0ABC8KMV8_ERUVS|nr:unnamed protein product [Eruca vesicaria subsp. sativa]
MKRSMFEILKLLDLPEAPWNNLEQSAATLTFGPRDGPFLINESPNQKFVVTEISFEVIKRSTAAEEIERIYRREPHDSSIDISHQNCIEPTIIPEQLTVAKPIVATDPPPPPPPSSPAPLHENKFLVSVEVCLKPSSTGLSRGCSESCRPLFKEWVKNNDVLLFWQVKPVVHAFQLTEEGPCEELGPDGQCSSFNELILPAKEFDGLWKSLIYESGLKQRLLRYVARMSEQEALDYRHSLGIRVSGFDVPRPVKTFEDCGFSSQIMSAIEKQAYEKPTTIHLSFRENNVLLVSYVLQPENSLIRFTWKLRNSLKRMGCESLLCMVEWGSMNSLENSRRDMGLRQIRENCLQPNEETVRSFTFFRMNEKIFRVKNWNNVVPFVRQMSADV